MPVKQLAKIRTGNPDLDRVQDHFAGVLNPVLRALPSAAGGQLLQPAWRTVAFLNGWSNFKGGFYDVSYTKDSQGFVHLRGVLVCAAGQGANLPALVLPEGFRPAATTTFAIVSDVGFCRVNVLANGEVWPSVNVAVAAGGFRSLDGISFDTRA